MCSPWGRWCLLYLVHPVTEPGHKPCFRLLLCPRRRRLLRGCGVCPRDPRSIAQTPHQEGWGCLAPRLDGCRVWEPSWVERWVECVEWWSPSRAVVPLARSTSPASCWQSLTRRLSHQMVRISLGKEKETIYQHFEHNVCLRYVVLESIIGLNETTREQSRGGDPVTTRCGGERTSTSHLDMHNLSQAFIDAPPEVRLVF